MNRLASAPAPRPRESFGWWARIVAPLTLLLGMLSGYLAGSGADEPWFVGLDKPALYPPPILFPIVWTVLYVLMGLALALILARHRSRAKGAAVLAFGIQFALNLSWPPVFFTAHRIYDALLVILALDVAVIATIVLFARLDKRAAWLLAPYLAWVLFATGLNWQLLADNPHAGGPPQGEQAAAPPRDF